MSAYDYSDRAKPASAHTKAVNAQLAHELGLEGDAPAWRELELAREGLVRAAEDLVIRDGDGHVIWDLDAFRFLQSPVPDERVNPKGTGYITDLGMTGPYHSVLGVRIEQSIAMFRGDLTEYFKTAPGDCAVSGAVFEIERGGKCVSVERVWKEYKVR